jgi:hypothetical protein
MASQAHHERRRARRSPWPRSHCDGPERRPSALVLGVPRGAITVDDRAMIAVQLMNRDRLRRTTNRPAEAIKPEGELPRTLPAEESTRLTTSFQPLDTSIVSEAIPVFFIGRNREGFWVARDVKGRIGGIFLFESSALSFARRKSRRTGCATIYQSETFELDLKNGGNPFIAHLGTLRRVAIDHQRRIIAFIDKTMKALRLRLKGFYVP